MRKQLFFVLVAAFLVTTACNRRSASLANSGKIVAPPTPALEVDKEAKMLENKMVEEEASFARYNRKKDMSKWFPKADQTVLSFRRTACYGQCPVYSLEIMGDGKIKYEGKAYVKKQGSYTSQLSSEQLAELMALVQDNGFYNMPATYPANGEVIADLPNAITTVEWKGRKNTVKNNHNASKELLELEAYLDKMIKELDWTSS